MAKKLYELTPEHKARFPEWRDRWIVQDAAVPHDGYDLPAGAYEFRISREYDPFAEQARRVAD